MKVQDYLIDHQGFDWPILLSDWVWLLPEEFTVWLMNKYGDLFMVFNNGTINILDVGVGSLEKLAESREEFFSKIDEHDNANDWLMIPLVDRLIEAGKTLPIGRCYSLVVPPVLGGEYTVENTSTLEIAEHYSVYATIHLQIKDLTDGKRVVLRTEG